MNLRRSPLHAEHERLGAKLVDFGGWEMPLSYPTGTIAEHLDCRVGAAAFDVSHLGTTRVTGPDAFDSLQRGLTNDLGKIETGRAQYTHMLDDDGGVLDDIIVWWVGPERFDVMPNASNTERVVAQLGGEDVTASRAIIAVQGPKARTLVASFAPEAAEVPRFAVRQVEVCGVDCVVAGTGYTGEDGIEIAVPAESATACWQAVVRAGAVPAGLGARDTLRLEAGLPLHGHELGPGITPLQAGLGWVVAWKKPHGFRGLPALTHEREAGPRRRLVALLTDQRRPPRSGDAILVGGEAVGEVTSGNYSPVLERGIALGFVPSEVATTPDGNSANDAALEIALRGGAVAARIVKPPFQLLPRHS